VFAISESGNKSVSPLFQAFIEVTEEAITNSLFMAEKMTGRDNTTVEALPLERVLPILRSRGVIRISSKG